MDLERILGMLCCTLAAVGLSAGSLDATADDVASPIRTAPPATPAPPVAPQPVLPPATNLPPPTPVTTCDPGGCWTPSGTRLEGAGATQLDKAGRLCQRNGVWVQCF